MVPGDGPAHLVRFRSRPADGEVGDRVELLGGALRHVMYPGGLCLMSQRWLSFIPTAALALAVLAACGGEQAAPEGAAPEQAAEEEVTRVPDAANAPATPATEDEATEEAAVATPATGAQTVAGGAATPVTGAMATPMDAGAMATPMTAGVAATPVAIDPATVATPDVAGATPAAGGASAAGDAAAVEAVTLVGFDIGWEYDGQRSAPNSPVNFSVAPGTTVELPNEGAAPHNFAVDELGISVDMPVGETVEAVIPGDAAPGTYEYYCNVPGHKPAGMVGEMTVE